MQVLHCPFYKPATTFQDPEEELHWAPYRDCRYLEGEYRRGHTPEVELADEDGVYHFNPLGSGTYAARRVFGMMKCFGITTMTTNGNG